MVKAVADMEAVEVAWRVKDEEVASVRHAPIAAVRHCMPLRLPRSSPVLRSAPYAQELLKWRRCGRLFMALFPISLLPILSFILAF
jgi:hypothetical protein